MALSIQQSIKALSIEGRASLLRDFYGYGVGAPGPLSLLEQAKLLQAQYINLNIIRVGVEHFTYEDEQDIDRAVYDARKYFAAAGIGIGRVQHWQIPSAEADGFVVISDEDEAEELTDVWSVANDGLDVFMVRFFTTEEEADGLSAVSGPCHKSDTEMTGTVVEMLGDSGTGLMLAHQLAHYLGLDHHEEDGNLMQQIVSGIALNEEQINTLKAHCAIKATNH